MLLFFVNLVGLERDKFDNKTVSFEEHIKYEHNMWNYLYFIVLVRVKNKTDYTGPESYVAQMIKVCTVFVSNLPSQHASKIIILRGSLVSKYPSA